jgi:sporulation protein YlmC with PRC-barrel domain
VEEMNKLFPVIGVFFVLSLGFVTGSQGRSMGQSGLTIYDTSKLIGVTVQSRDGVTLGQVFDLVVDSQGHVDFAIVSQPGFVEFPGRLIAVPFSSLRISKGESAPTLAVLKADKEKFYEAPSWGHRNLADRQQAASLDRYFGVSPYWTEETGKAVGR